MSRSSEPSACRRALVASCIVSSGCSLASWATAQGVAPTDTNPSDIVVTATRLPTPASEVASSVTVITADDIARQNATTLPDVLANVPGVSMVQTGGPGGIANLYIRGTNANDTKVLIDGIDVSDPSSLQGSFDFAHVLLSDVERIEVLRGPQSGLYGGDAIGGVVNIITKSGSGPLKLAGSIEGGSFDTLNESVGASGSQGRLSYLVGFGHFYTGATPVTPANIVPPGQTYNNDSYDNETATTKLGLKVTDTFDLGFVARFVDYTLDTQNTIPEPLSDVSTTRQIFARTTAHLVSFDGRLDQTVGIGYTDYHNSFLDPNYSSPEAFLPNPYDFSGDRLKFDWQGNITLAAGEIATLGAEHELDRTAAANTGEPNLAAENTTDSGYAQLQSSIAAQFFNTASVRYDVNSQFGGAVTFGEAPAYLIAATGTKLKASVGTGFNPPSLVELYENFPGFGFFGNPNLRPETSIGYDAGFEQAAADRRVSFGATYFRNDIKNLIATNALGTSYANIGRATAYGVESFVSWKPIDPLNFRADYTYTLAQDDILHQELLRRPKNKASLEGTWQASEAASLTATALYVGSSYDFNRAGTATYLPLNGYVQVNVAGNYELGHGVTAFARINNLLDRHYEYPLGFERPGLGVFAGVRVALDTGAGGT
jgi:vitamin B12 transporter